MRRNRSNRIFFINHYVSYSYSAKSDAAFAQLEITEFYPHDFVPQNFTAFLKKSREINFSTAVRKYPPNFFSSNQVFSNFVFSRKLTSLKMIAFYSTFSHSANSATIQFSSFHKKNKYHYIIATPKVT